MFYMICNYAATLYSSHIDSIFAWGNVSALIRYFPHQKKNARVENDDFVFSHVDCVPENASHAGRDPSDTGTASVSNFCYLLIGLPHPLFTLKAYQSVQVHRHEKNTYVFFTLEQIHHINLSLTYLLSEICFKVLS